MLGSACRSRTRGGFGVAERESGCVPAEPTDADIAREVRQPGVPMSRTRRADEEGDFPAIVSCLAFAFPPGDDLGTEILLSVPR